MKKENMLSNTEILFDDIDKYKPKMCIVKRKENNGLYVLEDSRYLDEQEIFRTFFGLAKYLETQGILSIAGREESLSFKFTINEEHKDILKKGDL